MSTQIEYEKTSISLVDLKNTIDRIRLQIEKNAVDLVEIEKSHQYEIDRVLRNKKHARNDARQTLNEFAIDNKENAEFKHIILAINIYFTTS